MPNQIEENSKMLFGLVCPNVFSTDWFMKVLFLNHQKRHHVPEFIFQDSDSDMMHFCLKVN